MSNESSGFEVTKNIWPIPSHENEDIISNINLLIHLVTSYFVEYSNKKCLIKGQPVHILSSPIKKK